MPALLAVLVLALLPAAAQAADPAALAGRLTAEVVVVEDAAAEALPAEAAGRLRLRIASRAIGRVKIAVVGADVRDMGELANAIDRAGTFRGALIATDGDRSHIVTSYDRPVADVLRPVLAPGIPQPLEEKLARAVDVLATLDPGPAGDGPAVGFPTGVTIGVPEGLSDLLRTVLLVLAVVVGAPFLLVTGVLVWRLARRRREAGLDLGERRAAARARLLAVAEVVAERESDSPAYARLVDRYAEAEALVDVPEADARQLRRAEAALAEAEAAAAATPPTAAPAPAAPA